MNIKVEEKKLNIKINQETKKIEVSIIDNSDKIDLNLTNYNDKEVRSLITENTQNIEELQENKADKTQIPTKLSQLINDNHTVQDNNYVHTDNNYTTTEKNKLANLENYDDTEVRQLIDEKQPRGNYLTEETDPTVPDYVKSITQQNITNWNNKADMSDIPDVSNFITKTVDDLINYYKKSETFTKQEVNDLISAVSTLDLQIVQTLPTEDISTTTIYLVPKATAETNNAYDEYIYITNAWEFIGSTEVDLTHYVQDTDYASDNKGGVIKTGAGYNTFVSYGMLGAYVNTYEDYLSRAYNSFISKGTLENVITGKKLYSKSNNGIPKTDLESTVQTSLGKADTALQSYTETDPTVPSHVKNITQANITTWNNKSDFSGSYNDLSNKPTIPVKDNYTIVNNSNNQLQTVGIIEQNAGNIVKYWEGTQAEYDAITTKDNSTIYYITDAEDIYVKNTDYATSTNAGVFKVSNGVVLGNTGYITCGTKNYQEYVDLSNNYFISKGTLENVITGKNLATKSDISKCYYGTSSTAAGTSAKVVACDNFVLEEGAIIFVKFTNAQTYNGTATLNVNNTGAKDIARVGTTKTTRYYWSAGEIVGFVYDGTNYLMIERGTATTTYYGITKLYTGAGSDSQAYALTPRSLYYLANYSIAPYYSTSKTYAVGDKVRNTYYLYECITAIDTPEAWTAEHWQQIDTIQEQIDNISNTIGDIESLLAEV